MTNFKKWSNLMWSNGYIQVFSLNFILLVIMIVQKDIFYTNDEFWMSIGFLSVLLILIAYFGFYKFWNDIKNSLK